MASRKSARTIKNASPQVLSEVTRVILSMLANLSVWVTGSAIVAYLFGQVNSGGIAAASICGICGMIVTAAIAYYYTRSKK
jgi:hypothetical protein